MSFINLAYDLFKFMEYNYGGIAAYWLSLHLSTAISGRTCSAAEFIRNELKFNADLLAAHTRS